mgnify:CR=1 FL=1
MYQLVAIGGTFDRLHKGHQSFILQAFQYGERIIIGLTSDRYVEEKVKIQKSKVKSQVNTFIDRKKELEKFLQQEGLMGRAEIVEIDDVYGPATGKNEIEALVVTSDTLEGGRKVNKKRRELGLKPLKLLKLPLIIAEDHKKIASTRIRLGEIDRWGRVFKFKIQNSKFKINENLRQELKKPLGTLIRGKSDDLHSVVPELKKIVGVIRPTMIITVGDEVTKLCNEIDLTVHLSIFDFRVNRKLKYTSMEDLGIPKPLARAALRFLSGQALRKTVVTVRNPAGHVKRSLVQAISRSIKGYLIDGKMRLVRVMGEEDLAGVPAVLLSPLGTLVLYGQPGEGIVVVEVTEEKKKQLIQMMDL